MRTVSRGAVIPSRAAIRFCAASVDGAVIHAPEALAVHPCPADAAAVGELAVDAQALDALGLVAERRTRASSSASAPSASAAAVIAAAVGGRSDHVPSLSLSGAAV